MPPSSLIVHSVYAFAGPDRFLRKNAIDETLRALAGEVDALGPAYVDGDQARLADVLDEVRTMSLLGQRRVVVVDEADDFISRHRAALERFCAAPEPGGVLLMACDSLPKNTRLYKIISEHGQVVFCEPPKGRALTAWVVERSRTVHGKRLSEAAAARLREHLGDGPGVLDAELTKLAAYVGARSDITPADIDALTGHTREETVFAVTDAIASGDTSAALRQWEQVLATDRAAPGRALAGLAWGVRRLLEARRQWGAGAGIGEIARRMYTEPRVLEGRLKRVTQRRLEGQQKDLLSADLAIKTGGSTLEVAVEKFIVKHCAGGS